MATDIAAYRSIFGSCPGRAGSGQWRYGLLSSAMAPPCDVDLPQSNLHRSGHPSLVQASSHPSWQCGLPDAACVWQRIVAVAPCEPEPRCLGERNLLIVALVHTPG